MATLKYIIVEENGHEHAILFPEIITHKQVSRVHRASDLHLVSAGFCSINQKGESGEFRVSRWGRSDSIPKDGRDEDKAIIEKSLNHHY